MLTDEQLERIADEANKAINKKFPMLTHAVEKTHLPYIIEAYHKVVKCDSTHTIK